MTLTALKPQAPRTLPRLEAGTLDAIIPFLSGSVQETLRVASIITLIVAQQGLIDWVPDGFPRICDCLKDSTAAENLARILLV